MLAGIILLSYDFMGLSFHTFSEDWSVKNLFPLNIVLDLSVVAFSSPSGVNKSSEENNNS